MWYLNNICQIVLVTHQQGQDEFLRMMYNKQMFVKHLPPARSEYRVPQRPITKTGTKEGQLTQRYY